MSSYFFSTGSRWLSATAMAVVVLLGVGAAPVEGGGNRVDRYDVSHKIKTTFRGDVDPRITAFYRLFADAKQDGVSPGARTNPGHPNATSVVLSPPAPAPLPDLSQWGTGLVNATNSNADANSSVNLTEITNRKVRGEIRAWGHADARRSVEPPGEAWARSSTAYRIYAGRNAARGEIVYTPVIKGTGSVSGSAQERSKGRNKGFDPITFEVLDLVTGEFLQGSLLDIEFSASSAEEDIGYSLLWEEDLFTVDALSASFSITIDSPFTTQQGSLSLLIDDGVVTESLDDGMFDGLLPALGTSGTVSFPLLNDIVLDYDLGEFSGHELDVALAFSGGGAAEAFVGEVPEPSTLLLLGAGLFGLAAYRRRRAS